jgi:hypothetical protein
MVGMLLSWLAIDTIPVAITIANDAGCKSAIAERVVFGVAAVDIKLSIKPEEIPQQADVEQKAAQAGKRRRPDNRRFASQPRIHRGRQQPQLHKHERQNDAQNAADDNRSFVP